MKACEYIFQIHPIQNSNPCISDIVIRAKAQKKKKQNVEKYKSINFSPADNNRDDYETLLARSEAAGKIQDQCES